MRRAVNALAAALHATWATLAEAERGRFAPWLAVAMVAGAAWFFSGPANPGPRTGASLLLGGLTLAFLARARAAVLALGLVFVAAGLGVAAAQWATARAPPLVDLPTRATMVTGTVALVDPLPQGRRLVLTAPSLDGAAPLPRDLRVRLRPGDPVSAAPGDRVRVRALFQRPAGAAWPGGWDPGFDAFFAGLAGYGYALGPAERLAAGEPTGPAARLQSLQQTIIARVHAALPGPEGRIAAALMIGGASGISATDLAAWRDSGLFHLLSISGLHLAIAMGLVFAAIRFALAAWEWAALHLPTKAIAAGCALAAGGFYTLLTGAQVPMLRSFAMAALVTLAILAGRRALSLRAWALAMAGIAAIAPQEVVRVSFQMSFAAVLALVAGFEALRPWLTRLRGDGGWPRRAAAYAVGVVLSSALAGTAATPFAAYHFGNVQVYYVLANLVAVPVTAVLVMPAAVLALLLMPLHLEALALVPMGWGVGLLTGFARQVAGLPQAVIAVPHIAPWGLAVLSLGMAWLALWRSRLRLAGLAMIAAGLASPLFAPPPDILVSADARLIGLRTAEGLFVQKVQGGNAFTLDSWQRLLGLRTVLALPGQGGGALSCDAASCTFHPRPGVPVALLLRGPPVPAACDAALVLSAEPLRLECAIPVPAIDRFSVWRQGAHAVWLLPGGPRIVTDRAIRGDRPWVAPLPTRARTPRGPALPMAEPDLPPASPAGEDDPV